MHLRTLVLSLAAGALAVHNQHNHLHKHFPRQDVSSTLDDVSILDSAPSQSTDDVSESVAAEPTGDAQISEEINTSEVSSTVVLDTSSSTCAPAPDITVELSPVSAVIHFSENTIVDPLLNGNPITITNAPIDLTIIGFLTVTKGSTVSTTRRTSTTTTTRTTTTSSRRTTTTTTTRSSSTSTRTSSTRTSSTSSARTSTSTSTVVSSTSTVVSSTVSSSRSSTSSSFSSSSSSSSSTTSSTGTSTLTTTTATTSYAPYTPTPPANGTYYVGSTILVIVSNVADGNSATSGLNGYGIPFEILYVPSTGANLPTLNSTYGGNYGGIIISGAVAYDYGGTFRSALTDAQYQQLFDYQVQYGVRMVQYNVYPGPLYGATALGGCCATGVEQLMFFTNNVAQSGLRTGATMSTQGLYHYPATIADSSTTREIARFQAAAGFPESTAAVINNFNGREQMVFFISWATDFSPTSNYLQHEYITWMTRGLYTGFRRVYLNTQIDDMFLITDLYRPVNTQYRVTPSDMQAVYNWVPTINAKMNPGSFYIPEVGHNGNGNIEYGTFNVAGGETICAPGSIEYTSPPDTLLEFKKPLGTGTNLWPTSPTVYGYSTQCEQLDPLYNWWRDTSHRDSFAHISHTFTHLELNNATYSDALKEIQFNQAWLQRIGFAAGRFTPNGLIPPAITGLHNGDAIRAWSDAGLRNCVGDNTRPVLRNQQNTMWPYTSTFAADGFDGYTVIPRWATRIYYNCDTPACTLQEWLDTSAGTGDFANLLLTEKSDTTRHLFGLFHDGYMFHQANLRTTGLPPITINGVSLPISIFQAWVETIVQEFVRLATWPTITLTQADLATTFINRQARDGCYPRLFWNKVGSSITGFTLSTNGNVCGTEVPVTVPQGVTVTDTQGFRTEQVGSDPLTIWVTMSGQAVTFSFQGSGLPVIG